ncbi:microcin C ABC transporter permease YejB [Devosia sp. J2-20]|jgi:microcin C transport system permease protein|uniref:microcin C ABC transporter permease YejB n=1 Tax=Devosia TaxID=46913 RepID=UPI0022AFBF4B|nr:MULTISPECIES: microcin C ABC transporter permease YejB [Devosia]MCZ4346711.1 microcin C ABC transporter permease YejB [Devosia neptuniae]WDQ99532.1 microcin C ABC transporter permease YejB [Devosia sp. J2-20]|tara:strand:+ start:13724 stop:14824 length:1101 start_codon:yes stop_codon:yes gene_type:complete
MGAYILRRILLMIPTVFGIMAISFLITQFAPGGPVEQALANLSGQNVSMTERITGSAGGDFTAQPGQGGKSGSAYRGSQGLAPELVERIEKQFGFDKPPLERFGMMLWNYLRFDFGDSYYRDISVIDLIKEKMPVSISLGLWMTLIAYGVSIPLGIKKAVSDGSRFDVWTSTIVIIGYAVPGFLVAIALIILFAGGSFWSIFPLRGLHSTGAANWPFHLWLFDYLWHLVLPIIAMGLGAFATTTLLTKNSFIDEIGKQYVTTARAKGLTENQVLYRHVFRNAMMLIIASFPAAFVGAFFGGSLLIETIFSLDGLGLLGFVSVASRDYPVVFATLYIFSLLGLVISLVSDLAYMWVDPRLDFESREV